MSACDADFQPNEAPPLSSVAVAAAGDVMTPKGSFPHTTPKALDKAGIDQVCTEIPVLTPNATFVSFMCTGRDGSCSVPGYCHIIPHPLEESNNSKQLIHSFHLLTICAKQDQQAQLGM